MSDKKRTTEGDRIRVGDISGSTGVAIGSGARATVTQGVRGEDLAQFFAPIYQQIQARPQDPGVEKEEIAQVVQSIEKETARGAEANPDKVKRWLRYLGTLAPDILEVTLASLANPAAGVVLAVRKAAEIARGELNPGLGAGAG